LSIIGIGVLLWTGSVALLVNCEIRVKI